MPKGASVSQHKLLSSIETLKKRKDFLRVAADGRRWVTSNFVLQIGIATHNEVRAGYTATKKLGNAVKRNFAKRRMRSLVRGVFPEHATPGHDYVVIARDGMLVNSFGTIRDELARAVSRVRNAKPRQRPSSSKSR